MRKIAPTILSESEIARAAPPLAGILETVAETYRLDGQGRVEVPTKIGVHPDHDKSFLHAMPAWVPDQRALGMKWISYFPGSQARGIPDSTGIIILNDPDIGLPVAIMEGMWITYARTTASALVMARHLRPDPPATVALIGCGGLGRWTLSMLREVFPDIAEVRVTSRDAGRRQDFCTEMAANMPWPVISCDSVQDAVAPADLILSSIAPPPAPFVRPEWLKPDVLAVAMDYFHCYTPEAIASFGTIVTDNAASVAAALPGKAGGDTGLVPVAFQALIAGRDSLPAGGRVLAIPTGIASVDMTLAWEIYRKAIADGLGQQVTLTS